MHGFWPPFLIRTGLNGDGGGITPEPEPEPGDGPIRVATPVGARVNLNGHSLVDSIAWNHTDGLHGDVAAGETWNHAILRQLMLDSLSPAEPPLFTRSTRPGYSTMQRWDDAAELNDYDPRANIADIDLLFLAEGGPHKLTGPQGGEENPLANHLDPIEGQRNWIDLARAEGSDGDGAEIIYYQIWPDIDGWESPVGSGEYPAYMDRQWTFDQWVDEYDRVAKWTSDYWTHHIGQRVYVFPGHRLYQRVRNDALAGLIPDDITVDDIFWDDYLDARDPIHPSRRGCWLVRVAAVMMIYKSDLRSVEGITLPAYITPEYHDYCCQTAWEVLQGYALAGFGGSDRGVGAGYIHGTHIDPLNPPEPESPQPPDPEDLPEFLLAATPQGYAGPVLSGGPTSAGAPVWVGDAWSIDGAVTAALSRSGPVYCCAVIRVDEIPSPAARGPLVILQAHTTWWQGALYALMYNGHIASGVYQTDQSSDVGGPANLGAASTGYALVWWYNDGAASGGGSGSSAADAIEAPAVPATSYLTIGGNFDGAPDIELRGLWIWTPDEGQEVDQLAAVRALAATYMPG